MVFFKRYNPDMSTFCIVPWYRHDMAVAAAAFHRLWWPACVEILYVLFPWRLIGCIWSVHLRSCTKKISYNPWWQTFWRYNAAVRNHPMILAVNKLMILPQAPAWTRLNCWICGIICLAVLKTRAVRSTGYTVGPCVCNEQAFGYLLAVRTLTVFVSLFCKIKCWQSLILYCRDEPLYIFSFVWLPRWKQISQTGFGYPCRYCNLSFGYDRARQYYGCCGHTLGFFAVGKVAFLHCIKDGQGPLGVIHWQVHIGAQSRYYGLGVFV